MYRGSDYSKLIMARPATNEDFANYRFRKKSPV